MFGTTSIVIVTRDQLAYTRLCVASIARCTPEPYELVFVDNGSADGTVEWGRGIADCRLPIADCRTAAGATVIENPENRGFPAAANQGIQAASGEQVLLLNNDTIVTPGWLGRNGKRTENGPNERKTDRESFRRVPDSRKACGVGTGTHTVRTNGRPPV